MKKDKAKFKAFRTMFDPVGTGLSEEIIEMRWTKDKKFARCFVFPEAPVRYKLFVARKLRRFFKENFE